MSITVQAVGTAGVQAYMGTLTAGENLHEAFVRLADHYQIGAGLVMMLGGLTLAQFTAYDFTTQTRHAPQTWEGALEIVGGHGTLSRLDNQPHFHLHLVVAQRDHAGATQLIGGHCAQAHAFAVEFTLLAFAGQPVVRAPHAETGLSLWHFPPLF